MKRGEVCPGSLEKMISFVRTVPVGSLASCRCCGGLISFRPGWIQHLTGDEVSRPCGFAERLRDDPALYGLVPPRGVDAQRSAADPPG